MKRNFGKVAVLMGGHSAEREISIKSGQAVLASLLRSHIDAVGIDTRDNVIAQLTKTHFDRIFIALHGRGGEDGTVQGLLENLGIPYTGSGVLGSALAMDKFRTKQLWQGAGLPTPLSIKLNAESNFIDIVEKLGLPLMVKPVSEGSSVGMTKVTKIEELKSAWTLATQFDSQVIAEQFIEGGEYTVAILQGKALPVIRLETPRTFYDFEAKYSDDSKTQYICPCGLSEEQDNLLKNLAIQAFDSLSAKGWGRVDIMCDRTGQPWLLEVNTIPGMTDHSLVPMAAKAAGMNFDELVLKILETC